MIWILLIVFLVAMILAFKFLPWWVSVLIVLGVVASLKLFGGRMVGYLFSLPFRAKGKPLRRAKIKVHSLQPIPAPADEPRESRDADEVDCVDEDDDENRRDTTPRRYYRLDVTISPQDNDGPFKFWEPEELCLVQPHEDPMNDTTESCEILSCHVLPSPSDPAPSPPAAHDDDGNEGTDDADDGGSKYFGERRVKLDIAIRENVRKLAFAYYFEKFGEVVVE